MTNRLVILFFGMIGTSLFSQESKITEEKMNMKTYMFSDPSPIPQIGRLYPYSRFDGYTDKGIDRLWNMVVLENDYIKVFVCPDIGGKIWGAIEKSTGKEFMYYNHVVKFRDVAMRGPWTSGGLEYNFGDIGHIPTCATPVDYTIKKNEDGSVSCMVGALDLPSRTQWNVEIRLEPDKAYFETRATWHNASPVPVTYYHWMNAAAKAEGNLEFFYPGNKRIGHGGEPGEWPEDLGREISRYEENDFGIYKSYHVINAYTDYFGGYWHDDDFGFGHLSTYDDKPGKKIWIWGLSDQGMIWEDLLTDSDGQYIEYQAGKLFNQAAHSSTFTPFKHRGFAPYDTDIMVEKWFPLKETGGMVAASEHAVLNLLAQDGKTTLVLSALQDLDDELVVRTKGDTLLKTRVELPPLDLFTATVDLGTLTEYEILLGDSKLRYSAGSAEPNVDRPVEPNSDFSWETTYGLYVQGLEFEKQRRYQEALEMYLKSHKSDPGFAPALDRIALAYYRIMDYEKALRYARLSLAVDTYGDLANYVYGLVQMENANPMEAKSSFSIAAQSMTYRSASYTELAKVFVNEEDFKNALHYLEKALTYNDNTISALEMLAVVYRKVKEDGEARTTLDKISKIDVLNQVAHAELLFTNVIGEQEFQSKITNELLSETYLELSLKYRGFGLKEEAIHILRLAPENPIVLLWLADMDPENETEHRTGALRLSPDLIFPHRVETAMMLKRTIKKDPHWKLKYYLSLIYWNKGLVKEAKELMANCDDTPEAIAFYLAKAELFHENKDLVERSLKSALKIAPPDWRVNRLKADRHLAENEFNEAKKTAKKFMKRYPEKAQFGMLYAKALMGMQSYGEAIEFLNKLQVLPYEGSTEGRALFYEAGIRAAYGEFQKKDYSKAIAFARKAKLWPKNLGVGKHYDVDERLDDYIIAYALEKLGNEEEAERYYRKIAEHTTPDYLSESSKLYLQLTALVKLENKEKALQLLDSARKNDMDNPYLEWVGAKYKKEDSDKIESELLNSNIEIQAYDTKFVDTEFQLVLDFLKILIH